MAVGWGRCPGVRRGPGTGSLGKVGSHRHNCEDRHEVRHTSWAGGGDSRVPPHTLSYTGAPEIDRAQACSLPSLSGARGPAFCPPLLFPEQVVPQRGPLGPSRPLGGRSRPEPRISTLGALLGGGFRQGHGTQSVWGSQVPALHEGWLPHLPLHPSLKAPWTPLSFQPPLFPQRLASPTPQPGPQVCAHPENPGADWGCTWHRGLATMQMASTCTPSKSEGPACGWGQRLSSQHSYLCC